MNGRTRRQGGFTLIELMIVVVIIGIIGSIAVGTFSSSGQDTRRVRAQADLQALTDAASRYYQARFTYDGMTVADLVASAQITLDEDNYAYQVIPAVDGQSFMVVARPVAGTGQEGDGAFMINDKGNRCYYRGDDDPDLNAPCPDHL